MNHAFLLSLIFLLSACTVDRGSQADLSSFQIQDGFELELVAAEPLVMDPVAMEIDEHGTVYVVEMPGYPLDIDSTGRIKILRDTDADGRFDESAIFAEKLILPTGIMRWKKGVIVTDAPDILYLEDSDGDGIADKREVLLTGFSRSNAQHNVNSPQYGLDNWIYLGHEGAVLTKTFTEDFGGMGEIIRFPNSPDAPTLPQNANSRCVRFQPDQKRLEMLSGRTQFGFGFDNWGHRFYTSSANHLYHEVIAAPYLVNKENLPISSARNYLPEYGPGSEIYPITDNPEHQILTDVGTITAASGLTLYQADAFPEAYHQVSFIAEPVHNLVHTDIIIDKRASFISKRQFEQEEFLASKDNNFRPVNFYIGPTGDMYLLDYYRKIIEHPEWMAKEVIESGQLYEGKDKGRIYMISSPKNASTIARHEKLFTGLTPLEWIPFLADPNIWWRRHAQRLLVGANDPSARGELVEPLSRAILDFALETDSELGLLHAMWTLEGMNIFDMEVFQKALSSHEAGVRENAIKIVEPYLRERRELLSQLYDLQDDPNPKVRFQLLCTISLFDDLQNQQQNIIRGILTKDIEDTWVQVMALAASVAKEKELIEYVVDHVAEDKMEATKSFVSQASEMIARKADQLSIKSLINTAARNTSTEESWWKAAVLSGLAKGIDEKWKRRTELDRERKLLLTAFAAHADPVLRKNSLELLQMLGISPQLAKAKISFALSTLSDPSADPGLKVDAISFLRLNRPEKYITDIQGLINPREAIDVQIAALRLLNSIDGESFQFATYVFDNWDRFSSRLHQEAIALMMKKEMNSLALLSAVESGKLHKSNISWSHTFDLLNHGNDEIKSLARQLLAGDEIPKGDLLDKFQSSLSGNGDHQKGKELYTTHCSTCHQLGGENGINFGPDLAAIRNRTKTALLNELLFPNEAIADGYGIWEVQLKNGEIKGGIISEELNDQIFLKDATDKLEAVSRAEIVSMKQLERSAMPEGLGNQLSAEEMKDLLTYLKSPYR